MEESLPSSMIPGITVCTVQGTDVMEQIYVPSSVILSDEKTRHVGLQLIPKTEPGNSYTNLKIKEERHTSKADDDLIFADVNIKSEPPVQEDTDEELCGEIFISNHPCDIKREFKDEVLLVSSSDEDVDEDMEDNTPHHEFKEVVPDQVKHKLIPHIQKRCFTETSPDSVGTESPSKKQQKTNAPATNMESFDAIFSDCLVTQSKPNIPTKRLTGTSTKKRKSQSNSKCSVRGCANKRYDQDGNKSGKDFFTIPVQEKLGNMWKEFLKESNGGKAVKLTASTKICSDHFRKNELRKCYNKNTHRYRCSRTNLVPCILSRDLPKSAIKVKPPSKKKIEKPPPPPPPVEEKEKEIVPNEFVCISCSLLFGCFGDYYCHKESHLKKEGQKSRDQMMKCVIHSCDTNLLNAVHAIQHMKNHTTEKPFTCICCGQKYDTKHERNCCKHDPSKKLKPKKATNKIQVANIPEEIVCINCDMPFRCYGDYYQHMSTHIGKEKAQTDIAGKQYKWAFGCVVPSCKLTFQDALSAIHHVTFHTTDKPYKCLTCYSQYDTPGERNRCNHKR